MDKDIILSLAQGFNSLADTLTKLANEASKEAAAPEPEAKPAPVTKAEPEKPKAAAEPEISLEEVRGKLAELSKAGMTDKMRELIEATGAKKLSGVDPSQYKNLITQADRLLKEV